MYQRSRTSWIKHIDFMLIDAIMLQLAFYVAYRIRFSGGESSAWDSTQYRRMGLIMLLIQIVSSLLLNNLSNVLRRGFVKEALSVLTLSLITLAFNTLYLYALHISTNFSRLHLLYTIIIFCIVDYIARQILKRLIIWNKFRNPKLQRALLVVSDFENAERIINDIRQNNLEGYNIKGLVLTDTEGPEGRAAAETPGQTLTAAETPGQTLTAAEAFGQKLSPAEISGVPVVADIKNAADYVCREWIDEVLICSSGSRVKSFVEACAEMGITLHTAVAYRNINDNKCFIESVGGHPVVTTAYSYISFTQALVKKLMDLAGGLVGSAFAILIMIVVGPVIYFNSPGPIIFRQTRIGKNGKKFTVYKLRSMYLDAEERKKEYMSQNRVADGMMFKLDFDPRIIGNKILPDGTKKTGIGEFIRKTSLDEFPQFFNVLLGDMSLVGTRPPTEDEWEKYEYHHRARLAMKPGITGLWQVSGRSQITDFEEVVKLDTAYICNYSLSLDIKILFKTIGVLFSHKGAM